MRDWRYRHPRPCSLRAAPEAEGTLTPRPARERYARQRASVHSGLQFNLHSLGFEGSPTLSARASTDKCLVTRLGTVPRRGSYIVRLMNPSPLKVVSLWAWGDLEEDSGGGTSCKVREFALLSDGREVTLVDDRGWTSSAPLDRISLIHVVQDVYNVVLPDDAEQTGEEHEWERFEQRLHEEEVAVTRDELRALPYRVILSIPPGSARWEGETSG
jgi:hypothetical protein